MNPTVGIGELKNVRDKVDRFLQSLNQTIELGEGLFGKDIFTPEVPQKKDAATGLNGHTTAATNGEPFHVKGNLKQTILKSINNHFTRFVRVHDVKDAVMPFFPEKKNHKNFQNQVAGILSDFKKDGKIAKHQFTTKRSDSTWGRVEWLDANGKPLKGREYIGE